jgi:hypothetical protein
VCGGEPQVLLGRLVGDVDAGAAIPRILYNAVDHAVRYNGLCPARRSGWHSDQTQMPLTVFDCKGISATRRAVIEGAVAVAGRSLSQPYEAWIAADPLRGAGSWPGTSWEQQASRRIFAPYSPGLPKDCKWAATAQVRRRSGESPPGRLLLPGGLGQPAILFAGLSRGTTPRHLGLRCPHLSQTKLGNSSYQTHHPSKR